MERDKAYELANRFRKGAKIDAPTLVEVAKRFCYGSSVERTAKATGLSVKSVRGLYIDLRARLARDEFAKWHSGNRQLTTLASVDMQEAIRDAFYDTLSRCYFNSTCYRNFEAGNRKSRLCRSCPISERLSNPDFLSEAIELVDTVRGFYKRIGIGKESETHPVTLWKERVNHVAVMVTASQSTRSIPGKGFDYTDQSYLSFRTLLDTLLLSLLDEPL